jgi:adenine-specific DNA-methyltransferase
MKMINENSSNFFDVKTTENNININNSDFLIKNNLSLQEENIDKYSNNTNHILNEIPIINIKSRRYIGNKYQLSEWIFSIIDKECSGEVFADIFAGTGVISSQTNRRYKKIILNDFLYSNYIIYQAFFGKKQWNKNKVKNIIIKYNNLNHKNIKNNYFSLNFGGKYFTNESAKLIGSIRNDIENNKKNLSEMEYCILIASLLYAVDRIANTVGHYEAYFKNKIMLKIILK